MKKSSFRLANIILSASDSNITLHDVVVSTANALCGKTTSTDASDALDKLRRASYEMPLDTRQFEQKLEVALNELRLSVERSSPNKATTEIFNLQKEHAVVESTFFEIQNKLKALLNEVVGEKEAVAGLIRERSRLSLLLTWNSALIQGFLALHDAEQAATQAVGKSLASYLRSSRTPSKKDKQRSVDALQAVKSISRDISSAVGFVEETFSKMISSTFLGANSCDLDGIRSQFPTLLGEELLPAEEFNELCAAPLSACGRLLSQLRTLQRQLDEFVNEVRGSAPPEISERSDGLREYSDIVWRTYGFMHNMSFSTTWASATHGGPLVSRSGSLPQLISLLQIVPTAYRSATGLGVGDKSVVALAAPFLRLWRVDKSLALNIVIRELEVEKGITMAVVKAIDDFRFLDDTSRGSGVVYCKKGSTLTAKDVYPNTWKLLTFLCEAIHMRSQSPLVSIAKGLGGGDFAVLSEASHRRRLVDDVQCARFLKSATQSEKAAAKIRGPAEDSEVASSFLSLLSPKESFVVALLIGSSLEVESEKRRLYPNTHFNSHKSFTTAMEILYPKLTSYLEDASMGGDLGHTSEFINLTNCCTLLTALSGTNAGGDAVYCLSNILRNKLSNTQRRVWLQQRGSRDSVLKNGVPLTAMLQIMEAVSSTRWTSGPLFGFSHQLVDSSVPLSVFRRHDSQLIYNNVVKCALSHSALVQRKLAAQGKRRREKLSKIAKEAGGSSESMSEKLHEIQMSREVSMEKVRRQVRRLKLEYRVAKVSNTRNLRGFLSLYKLLLGCCQPHQLKGQSNLLSKTITLVDDVGGDIGLREILCEVAHGTDDAGLPTLSFPMVRHVVSRWEQNCFRLGQSISKRLFSIDAAGSVKLSREHSVPVGELRRFLNEVSKYPNMPSPHCCVLERSIATYLLNDTQSMESPHLSGVALSFAARFGSVSEEEYDIPTAVCLHAVQECKSLLKELSRDASLLPASFSSLASNPTTADDSLVPTSPILKLGTEHRVHTLLAHHADEMHPRGFLAAMTLVNPFRASGYRRQISSLTYELVAAELAQTGVSEAHLHAARRFIKNEITPKCRTLPEAIPIHTQQQLINRLTKLAPTAYCGKPALARILKNVVSTFDVRALNPVAMSDLFHLFSTTAQGGVSPLSFKRKLWLLEALALLERRTESAADVVYQCHHADVASFRYPLVKAAVVDSLIHQIKATSVSSGAEASVENSLHVNSSEALTIDNFVDAIRVLKLADAFSPKVFSRLSRFIVSSAVVASDSEDPLASSDVSHLAISERFLKEDSGVLSSNGNFPALLACFAAMAEEYTTPASTGRSNQYAGSQFEEVLWPVFRSTIVNSGSRFSLKECTSGLKAFSHLDLEDSVVFGALVRRIEVLYSELEDSGKEGGDGEEALVDSASASPIRGRIAIFSQWVSSLDTSTCVALLGNLVGTANDVAFVRGLLPMLVHHLLAIGTTAAPSPPHLADYSDPTGARTPRTPHAEIANREQVQQRLNTLLGRSQRPPVGLDKVILVDHLYPVDVLHLIPAELVMLQHADQLGLAADVPLLHSLYDASRTALLTMFGNSRDSVLKGPADVASSPSVTSIPVSYFVSVLRRLVHLGLKDDDLVDLCLREVTKSGHRLEALDKEGFMNVIVAAFMFRGAVDDWPRNAGDVKALRKAIFRPLIDHLWFHREHGIVLETADKAVLLSWMKAKFGMVDDDVVLRLGMSPSTRILCVQTPVPSPEPVADIRPASVESQLSNPVALPAEEAQLDGDFWSDVLMLDD